MIVRIWRTHIDQARADEYRDFAHSRSLPMFRTQPGFAGALFAARRAERVVITLWRDLASAQALGHSRAYRATVAEIEATGIVMEERAWRRAARNGQERAETALEAPRLCGSAHVGLRGRIASPCCEHAAQMGVFGQLAVRRAARAAQSRVAATLL